MGGVQEDHATEVGPDECQTCPCPFDSDHRCVVAVILTPGLPAHAANPITFAPHVDYPTGVRPEAVVSADFNVDGKPDLATADRFDWEISILLGAGAGTFAPRVGVLSGPEPTGIVAGDFNGDGKTDLAASINSAVSVLLATATGR